MTGKQLRESRQCFQPTGVAARHRRPGRGSSLPPLQRFQEQFHSAFDRELSREERRFYRLINIVLEEQAMARSAAPPLSISLAKTGTDTAGNSTR